MFTLLVTERICHDSSYVETIWLSGVERLTGVWNEKCCLRKQTAIMFVIAMFSFQMLAVAACVAMKFQIFFSEIFKHKLHSLCRPFQATRTKNFFLPFDFEIFYFRLDFGRFEKRQSNCRLSLSGIQMDVKNVLLSYDSDVSRIFWLAFWTDIAQGKIKRAFRKGWQRIANKTFMMVRILYLFELRDILNTIIGHWKHLNNKNLNLKYCLHCLLLTHK